MTGIFPARLPGPSAGGTEDGWGGRACPDPREPGGCLRGERDPSFCRGSLWLWVMPRQAQMRKYVAMTGASRDNSSPSKDDSPGPPSCPTCGSPGVPILYGLPGSEAAQAADESRLVLGGCFPQETNWACTGPEQHVWKSGDEDDPRWRSAVSSALKQWGVLCSDVDGEQVWIGTRALQDSVAVTISSEHGPDNEVVLPEGAARQLLAMLDAALSATKGDRAG
jgi:hypothetical protein